MNPAESAEPIDPVDKRLTELEISLGEILGQAEDLAERLNEVVVRQQMQIDRLVREVAQLAQLVEKRGDARDTEAFGGLRDGIPPHERGGGPSRPG